MRRRVAAVVTGACAVVAWFVQFLATHWPTPSVAGARSDDVRATWRAAAKLGRAVGGSGYWPAWLEWLPGDKVLHVLLFAAVGGLTLACAELSGWSWRARAALFAGLSVIAVLDEWSQTLVGRDAEVGDGFANILGLALGSAIVMGSLWAFRVGRRLAV